MLGTLKTNEKFTCTSWPPRTNWADQCQSLGGAGRTMQWVWGEGGVLTPPGKVTPMTTPLRVQRLGLQLTGTLEDTVSHTTVGWARATGGRSSATQADRVERPVRM